MPGRGRRTQRDRSHATHFLFLFLASDPSGSSTSIPSASLRPAAPLEVRLLAFCFSRRRSATSLSTTLSVSSCSAPSRALAALCSARETSFASSVWRSVAVVEDLCVERERVSGYIIPGTVAYQCSREVRISVMDSWGASLPMVYSTSKCCSFWSSLPRMMSR